MEARPARPNTIHRPRNQVRLVVTLEVECDMRNKPNWQPDAIDVVRKIQDEVLDRLRAGKSLKPLGLKVLSDKIEVSK